MDFFMYFVCNWTCCGSYSKNIVENPGFFKKPTGNREQGRELKISPGE